MVERSKIAVETHYSTYQNSLILTQKGVELIDNSFFFQVLVSQGGSRRLTSRVEDSELTHTEVTTKEFILLQDTIRGVLDEAGKAATIKLGSFNVQIVHFPNGEIGVGIGKGKYLLEKTDAEVLRDFCAQTM